MEVRIIERVYIEEKKRKRRKKKTYVWVSDETVAQQWWAAENTNWGGDPLFRVYSNRHTHGAEILW